MGYALKKKGQCVEAIARFDAALSKEQSAKAYLNRAECEEILARYTRAYRSLVAGRALAVAEASESLIEFADARFRVVIPKISLLTVTAAPDVTVEVDGATVTSKDELPLDPGTHIVVGHSEGSKSSRVEVTLLAGERRALQVAAGAREASVVPAGPTSTAPASRGTIAPTTGEVPPPASGPPWKAIGLVVAGVGVVEIAVGSYLAFAAKKDYSKASDAHCNGSQCDAEGVRLTDAARTQSDVATWVIVGGGLLTAGGLGLLLFAPSSSAKASSTNVGILGPRIVVTHTF